MASWWMLLFSWWWLMIMMTWEPFGGDFAHYTMMTSCHSLMISFSSLHLMMTQDFGGWCGLERPIFSDEASLLDEEAWFLGWNTPFEPFIAPFYGEKCIFDDDVTLEGIFTNMCGSSRLFFIFIHCWHYFWGLAWLPIHLVSWIIYF